MATKYVKAATKQIGGLYDQQLKATQAQIPAIQKLYDTIVSGLRQSNQQQLNTGVQNIVEDASARGVLRSTLPVDARTTLTSQLGAALAQSLGQTEAQRAQDISGVQSNIGNIRLQKANNIYSLADTLRNQDLQQQQFQLEKEKMALQKAQLAAQASAGSQPRALNNSQRQTQAASQLAQELRKVSGADGYVSPQDYAAAAREWGAAGFTNFDALFKGFRNPKNTAYKYYLSGLK